MSKIVYLGTSGAMPTIDRGLSCSVVVLEKEYVMIDCGDGTCRQYLKSNLKWNKPLTIIFTHMHSDHTVGILGLLQSADLMGRKAPVKIYGIKGIKQFIENLHRGHGVKFGFDFEIHEVQDGDLFSPNGTYDVYACETDHTVKPSLAYKIVLPDKKGELDIRKCLEFGVPNNTPLLGKLKRGEDITFEDDGYNVTVRSKDVVGEPQKGKVIAFSGDTRPTDKLTEFFKGVDYLTYETTFRSDELDLAKRAKHSTAEEAGKLAEKAGVKRLIVNHFSARHTSTDGFYQDIREHYKGRIIVSQDFLEVRVE